MPLFSRIFKAIIFEQFVIDFGVVDVRAQFVGFFHRRFKYSLAFSDNPRTKVVEAVVTHAAGDDETRTPETPLIKVADLFIVFLTEV